MRLSLGALIAGGLLVVACSGSSDDPVESSVSPSAAATTEPAVQTTTPAATDPPATDPPPTSEPAPATTEQSTEALIAEIEADLNEGEQALLTALGAPDDPESEELLRRYFTGAALDSILKAFGQLRSNGFVGRQNGDVSNVIVVRELADAGSGEATVTVCRVDATVIIDLLPGGAEVVIDDEISTVVSESTVRLQDGVWVFSSGTRIADLGAATSCE